MIKTFPTAKEILAVQKFLKRFSKITISAESKFELSQYLKDFPCQQLGALSTRTELKGYISEMQRKVQIQIILYQPITFEKVGGEWQFEIDQTKKNIEYRLNFLNEENTYLSSQVELLRKEMAGEVTSSIIQNKI